MYGHNVSHANNKTLKIFKPNISYKRLFSEKLGNVRVKISRRGERTIEKYNGIDSFVLNYKKLTQDAENFKKRLLKYSKRLSKQAEKNSSNKVS